MEILVPIVVVSQGLPLFEKKSDGLRICPKLHYRTRAENVIWKNINWFPFLKYIQWSKEECFTHSLRLHLALNLPLITDLIDLMKTPQDYWLRNSLLIDKAIKTLRDRFPSLWTNIFVHLGETHLPLTRRWLGFLSLWGKPWEDAGPRSWQIHMVGMLMWSTAWKVQEKKNMSVIYG